jgi:hypothetical protein
MVMSMTVLPSLSPGVRETVTAQSRPCAFTVAVKS